MHLLPFGYLSEDIYLDPLPIFNYVASIIAFHSTVLRVSYQFWTQVVYQVYDFQIFSSIVCIVFSLPPDSHV